MNRKSFLWALGAAAMCMPLGAAAHDGPGGAHLGDIAIHDAYVRANPAPNGASAAYMRIETTGGADALIAVSSPVAKRAALHTHLLDDAGVARMRPVDEIPLAPGHPAILEPGGYHVMLMGLEAPLEPGQAIALTLTFAHGGDVTLMAPVRAVAAPGGGMPMDMGHGAGHDMKGGHGEIEN